MDAGDEREGDWGGRVRVEANQVKGQVECEKFIIFDNLMCKVAWRLCRSDGQSKNE